MIRRWLRFLWRGSFDGWMPETVGATIIALPPRERASAPHCDARILHAPGECRYCDASPEWQRAREVWGISFTGHDDQSGELFPCPADLARPPGSRSDHRRWGGNLARPA